MREIKVKWRLGEEVPKDWEIPKGVSHKINLGIVIRLARNGRLETARWLLERYKYLRYVGIELKPTYQKGWGKNERT